jgi:hypothetical protein
MSITQDGIPEGARLFGVPSIDRHTGDIVLLFEDPSFPECSPLDVEMIPTRRPMIGFLNCSASYFEKRGR